MVLRILIATAVFGISSLFSAEVEKFDAAFVETVMVAMRDGTRLATDVYLPAREEGLLKAGSPSW
jgi:predicted acyl esterase